MFSIKGQEVNISGSVSQTVSVATLDSLETNCVLIIIYFLKHDRFGLWSQYVDPNSTSKILKLKWTLKMQEGLIKFRLVSDNFSCF